MDEFCASHFKVSDSGDREGENRASGDESIPDGNRSVIIIILEQSYIPRNITGRNLDAIY